MRQLFVGTSGFAYPSWRGRFYPLDLPPRKFLHYYAQNFPAVELNVTFYRWPRIQTLVHWRAEAGEAFRFAVKVHRVITHKKRLRGCGPELARLQELCHHLRPSVLLIQLPPSLVFDRTLITEFADSLPRSLPPLAWEARHKSFFDPEALAFFRRAGWSLVVADSGGRFPTFKVVTAAPLYLRFHGPGPLYASSYTKAQLASYALWIREILAEKESELYAFFNNDVGGYALDNARDFAAFLTDRELAQKAGEN